MGLESDKKKYLGFLFVISLLSHKSLQGSWMVQFLTVIISLYFFSHAYNVVLVLTFPSSKLYTIDSKLGVTNSRYSKNSKTWPSQWKKLLVVRTSQYEIARSWERLKLKALEAEIAWSWERSKLRSLEAENARSWERSKLRTLEAENARSRERSKLTTLEADNTRSWQRSKLRTLEDIRMSAKLALSSTVALLIA